MITKSKAKKFDLSSEAQCVRLLNRLKKGACTTVQLRHEEDIVAPAARVHRLRHELGLNVKTFYVTDSNPGGGRHRFAKYVLMPGVWGEDALHG